MRYRISVFVSAVLVAGCFDTPTVIEADDVLNPELLQTTADRILGGGGFNGSDNTGTDAPSGWVPTYTETECHAVGLCSYTKFVLGPNFSFFAPTVRLGGAPGGGLGGFASTDNRVGANPNRGNPESSPVVRKTEMDGPFITLQPFTGTWYLRANFAFLWGDGQRGFDDVGALRAQRTDGSGDFDLFRIDRNWTQSDFPGLSRRETRRDASCGGLTFAHCSGWQSASVDVSALVGDDREFQLHILVHEVGPGGVAGVDDDAPSALAFDGFVLDPRVHTSGDEGAVINLIAPAADVWAFRTPDFDESWHWTVSGSTCTIADPDLQVTTMTCSDDGTFDVDLTIGGQRYLCDPSSCDLQPPSARGPLPFTDDVPGAVTVNNVAPSVSTPTLFPSNPTTVGAPVIGGADFSDPSLDDLNDPALSCTIDYGDGSGPIAGQDAGGHCHDPGDHQYSSPGTYTLTVTVTDDDGGTGRASTQVVVTAPVTVTLLETGRGQAVFEATWSGTGPFAWDARPVKRSDGPKAFRDPEPSSSAVFTMTQQSYDYPATFTVWDRSGGGYSVIARIPLTVPMR